MYTTVNSCRFISLLNCLGKVTEKVVTEMLSIHCEGKGGGLHNGQYGCWKGRSAFDAVGMLVAHVQKAWAQWQVAGVLCMDIEAAFPSIVLDCLALKLRKIGVDECSVM
jgi:uridine phosphorylase